MSALTHVRRCPAAVLAIGLVLLLAVPVAQGATPAPCRVVNLTQDTYGRSLVRMIERATNGDRLHVRGTCPGHVIVDVDVVIRGKGEDPTLAGRGRYTAVRVKRGATVTIRDLTIQHGKGVRNEGRLTVRGSLVRRSTSLGIYNQRHLTLIDSAVRHNAGSGIMNNIGSTLEILRSVIRGNTGTYGGGIWNEGSTTTIRDSTIAGNRARFQGGGIFNGEPGSSENGTLILIGTTITGNVADSGGGIYNQNYSSITLDATSSVTGNIPDDCAGEGCPT